MSVKINDFCKFFKIQICFVYIFLDADWSKNQLNWAFQIPRLELTNENAWKKIKTNFPEFFENLWKILIFCVNKLIINAFVLL